MERRGFLGMLAAVVSAPFVPVPTAGPSLEALKRDPRLFCEVFAGSFEIGTITRRTAPTRSFRGRSSLIDRRVEETVRNLGAYVDRVYSERSRSRAR